MRFLCLLALLSSCTANYETRATYEILYSKSSSPIKLQVNFENEPVIGRNARLVVNSSLTVDTDNFELSVSNQKGNQKPQKAWKGGLKKDCCAKISHDVFIDSDPIELVVVAKSEFPDGTRFVREAHVNVNKPKGEPKGIPGKNSKGEDIIEFPQDKK